MEMRKWALVYCLISVVFVFAANIYTHSSPFDFSLGHLFVAGTLGFLITAFIFVLVESVLLLIRVFERMTGR
jgi:hypothetical protein